MNKGHYIVYNTQTICSNCCLKRNNKSKICPELKKRSWNFYVSSPSWNLCRDCIYIYASDRLDRECALPVVVIASKWRIQPDNGKEHANSVNHGWFIKNSKHYDNHAG